MALTVTPKHVSPLPGAKLQNLEMGEAIENGEAYYIKASDGKAYKARANAAATAFAHGICVSVNRAGETVGEAGRVMTGCYFGPIAGFSGMTPGASGWLSSGTAGDVTETKPTGAGTWSHRMGYAEAEDKFIVMPGTSAPDSNS